MLQINVKPGELLHKSLRKKKKKFNDLKIYQKQGLQSNVKLSNIVNTVNTCIAHTDFISWVCVFLRLGLR